MITVTTVQVIYNYNSALQPNKRAHTWVPSDFHNNLMKGASQVVLVVKNLPAMQEMQETWVWSLGWEDLLGHGNPLQYSYLENAMDSGA